MLLSMIPYPKVLSRFRLTSISLRSRFALASLSLHSHFTLTSLSLRSFSRCSVTLWLCCSQTSGLLRRRVHAYPKQFYRISEHNADIPCVLSSRLQEHCSPRARRASSAPPTSRRASLPANEAQASGVIGKLILVQTVEVSVVLLGSGSNEGWLGRAPTPTTTTTIGKHNASTLLSCPSTIFCPAVLLCCCVAWCCCVFLLC